jgi:hypothetical protein
MSMRVLQNTEPRKWIQSPYNKMSSSFKYLNIFTQLILLVSMRTKSQTVIYPSQHEKTLILRAESD